MKKLTQLALILPLLFITGCGGLNGFAKVVKEGGTADKEIDAEFSGWNAHAKYHSKPIRWTTPTTNSEAVVIVPTTTLEIQQRAR